MFMKVNYGEKGFVNGRHRGKIRGLKIFNCTHILTSVFILLHLVSFTSSYGLANMCVLNIRWSWPRRFRVV